MFYALLKCSEMYIVLTYHVHEHGSKFKRK
jgi:hypothetical protein